MLPKNKLRNVRLARLKIFEDENAGMVMKNVMRRFDKQVIITPTKAGETAANAAATVEDVLPEMKLRTKAVREEDTPPLGSLGGQQPKALYVPKPQKPKVSSKKPAPGQMKILDSEGQEWGHRSWKANSTSASKLDRFV